MPRLHIQRLAHGLLISPATDVLVRAFLESYIPSCYWRPVYRADAVLLDPSLIEFGTYLAIATYGLKERCVPCWEGFPCTASMGFAQNESMPTTAYHALRARDSSGRPCLLVKDKGNRLKGFLGREVPFSHHHDRELQAWYIDGDSAAAVLRALKRSFKVCDLCDNGQACWIWQRLADEGYHVGPAPRKPRSNAATLLGLQLPASAEEIQRAFTRKALEAHPDHGGTDQRMMEILDARAELLKRSKPR